MKKSNIFFSVIFTGIALFACKKEKTSTTNNAGGVTTPTSNYYVFDGVTYTGWPGWGQANTSFNFFCSSAMGDQDMRLYLYCDTSHTGHPTAGTYSVIAHTGYMKNDTTCSITVKNSGTTYQSTGGGTVAVGKSGTQTTYKFTDILLTGNKKVSGDFIY